MRLLGHFRGDHAAFPDFRCPRCKDTGEWLIALKEHRELECEKKCGQKFRLGFDEETQQPVMMDAPLKLDRSGDDAI